MTVSLYPITAVILLDNTGTRILSKYYINDHHGLVLTPSTANQAIPAATTTANSNHVNPFSTLKDQLAFEKQLFERTHKQPNNEIAMLENGFITVYRSNLDFFLYVIGAATENELFLFTVLETYFDTLSEVLKPQLDKKAILDSFDTVILALDEIVDRGLVLETDYKEVLAKVAKPNVTLADINIHEQTLSSAFQLAKEQMKTFLR